MPYKNWLLKLANRKVSRQLLLPQFNLLMLLRLLLLSPPSHPIMNSHPLYAAPANNYNGLGGNTGIGIGQAISQANQANSPGIMLKGMYSGGN